MPETGSVRLTRFETEIMNSLWEHGRISIREIRESYPEKEKPAYTSVQTIVYRLEAKGAVRRVKKIGNAHIFGAAVTPEAAHRRIGDDLPHLFGAQARPLLALLFDSEKLTAEDIRHVGERLASLPYSGSRADKG